MRNFSGFKSAAIAAVLLVGAATPAFACGCCGGGATAAAGGKAAGGCMGAAAVPSSSTAAKKPMSCMGGMASMDMSQKNSDAAMMGEMDHSNMDMSKMDMSKMDMSKMDMTPSQPMSTGSVSVATDADFAKAMIPHHQSAIDMATAYLKSGTNPELKKMAEDIIKTQEKEIAFLNGWIAGRAK